MSNGKMNEAQFQAAADLCEIFSQEIFKQCKELQWNNNTVVQFHELLTATIIFMCIRPEGYKKCTDTFLENVRKHLDVMSRTRSKPETLQ